MLKVRWLDAVDGTTERAVDAREVTIRGDMLFFLDAHGGVLLIVPQNRLIDAAEVDADA